MNKYARIIVDIPAAGVNQNYDYLIPEKLKNCLQIGHLVEVPFGRRKIAGFVTGFTSETEIARNKIKKINCLKLPEPLFDEKMLKLFKWIASYYNSYLIKVIKTAIPAGIVEQRISKKELIYVSTNKSNQQIKAELVEIKKRAPRQAAVLEVFLKEQKKEYALKDLVKIANSYRGAVDSLVQKGYLRLFNKVEQRKPFMEKTSKDARIPLPTDAQKKAIQQLKKVLSSGKSDFFLLHGVTGSGKTEVYLNIIREILKKKQGAIVLVPEISLTPVMVRRFYSRFGEQIAVLHSSLSAGERYDEWLRIKNGKARIVVGARSAIFAPVKNPGIIIIDEEHENSYKQGEYPYYHARRVAYIRGKIEGAQVLLGSATPSLESFHFARKKLIKYLDLPQRVKQRELPPVILVDMRQELKEGNTNIFSRLLQQEIESCLAKNQQALLFLNRRGYANFVLCRDCGLVIKCDHCDISLTYHAAKNILRCHYCDYQQNIPLNCPGCGSKYIKEFGVGTEKIERLVQEMFPAATVARMDVDTTTRKGAYRKILKRVEKGEIDILVGTQMIAKGHDYPGIGVVGVISADTILNLPDFRSAERSFQLLTQVAGRTGRGEKPGQVIIQTYSPQHYSIQAARNHDYEKFYEKEIKLRKELNYPPFCYLVNIVIKGQEEQQVVDTALELGGFINQKKLRNKYSELLGPSSAPIKKIRGKYRWQLIIKFQLKKNRQQLLQIINRYFLPEVSEGVQINIDVDPLSML